MDILVDVVGYEGLYKINKNGQVWGCKSKRFITLVLRGKDGGRYSAQLSKNDIRKGYYIHKLLAEHFIPNPENLPFIDHIDRNKHNNSLDNLRWATASTNMFNKEKHKNNKSGYKNINTRINTAGNEYWVIQISRLYLEIFNKKDFTLDQVIAIRDDLYIEFGLKKYD
jgi:hypothetical protein